LPTSSPSGPLCSPRYEINHEGKRKIPSATGSPQSYPCATRHCLIELVRLTFFALQALEGKDVKDLLSNVGSGGAAAAGPAAGGAAAGGAAEAAVEEEKEEEKEESDDDMGFGLFD
jgi:hypothetical protein